MENQHEPVTTDASILSQPSLTNSSTANETQYQRCHRRCLSSPFRQCDTPAISSVLDQTSHPTTNTLNPDSNFGSVHSQLQNLAENNRQYFAQQKTDVCRRFERLLNELLHSLESCIPLVQYITDNSHHFDYSPEIQANGYRTLLLSQREICLRTLSVLQQIDTKRVGFMFNLMYASKLFQDLKSWTKALIAMQHLLSYAGKMMTYSNQKDLYVDAREIPLDIELEYFKIGAFESEHFFGRTCGFQFTPGMQTILTFLLAGFATYYETYQRSIPLAAAKLAFAPKYLLFHEQRARKCASIFRDCDYTFCKSFWNLVDHDYIKMGSRYIAPSVTVSKYFQIGPDPIEIGSIVVHPPTIQSESEKPKQLVNIKLLSHEIREGMSELPLLKTDLETSSTKIIPMSDQLMIHVHGGGFIATSSATHEIYLKPWALGLEIPIVSIDYSLAPEHPFPWAIEECFYAYAWILKNSTRLGWTGKILLCAGDSAGGNIITVITMKAIELGLRKPDAIICFYTPFFLGYSMSPSRLIAVMDPLINTGFLWRCLAAYAGVKSSDGSIDHNSTENMEDDPYCIQLGKMMGSRQAYLFRKLRESTLPNHPYMSPLRAPEEVLRRFPTTYLIACHHDPLLDDSISFARRLQSLSVEHYLIFIHELPHGFLNFYTANHHCKDASDQIIGDIARRYGIPEQFSAPKKKKNSKKRTSTIVSSPMMNRQIYF